MGGRGAADRCGGGGAAVPAGGLERALGARAFGFNHFTMPAGATGHEHDETDSGQEEVLFVIEGSGTLRIDGAEELPGKGLRHDRDEW